MIWVLIVIGVLFMILIGCGQRVNRDNVEEEFMIDKAEFENVVNNLKNYDYKEGESHIIRNKEIMYEYGLSKETVKKYGVVYVGVDNYEATVNYRVYFAIKLDGWDYSGIYYTSASNSLNSDSLGEYDEEKQEYTKEESSHQTITKMIADNWFLSKEQWYRSAPF